MANLRGRAGRLLKDFIGRTFVLDEGEFENTESYDQDTLFDDVSKSVPVGYSEIFEPFKEDIVNAVESDRRVNHSMHEYGYLVTYIRQSVLRDGPVARQRMAKTGVKLTQKQVAAIIAKLNTITVPKAICLHNRYWDPFVLNDIYYKYNGDVPNYPTEKGAKDKLSDVLKFLRENDSTSEMYERYIPAQYRKGKSRSLLCSTCIKWSSEMRLADILTGKYFEGDEAPDRIEDTIKLLQETISFNIPLLIKPIIEMKSENSAIVACLQTGACKPYTRKMIDIGVPRELAITLNNQLYSDAVIPDDNGYQLEKELRSAIQSIMPELPYWEQVQLTFLQ